MAQHDRTIAANPGSRPRSGHSCTRIFPEDARKHLKVATREQLMAARVYLDRWIARLDEQEAARAESRPHEKIDIE